MNNYFKYFKIPLIITAVISFISLALYFMMSGAVDYNRYNQEYDNSVCVYDYAGKMTDDEVATLNQYLYEVEQSNCVDIAFITIADDEYGYLDAVHELAEDTIIDWKMGFDGEGGNAVVFIDNWTRGGDGYIHSWIAARGDRVRGKLSDSRCEDMLNILDDIPSDDSDPYYQYMSLAEAIYKRTRVVHPPFGVGVCLVVSIIVAALYIAINWNSKVADVTVTNSTYLDGGRAQFPVRKDLFLHKTVTKRKIERSSSSGGSSGGGGGFSGGGHSR